MLQAAEPEELGRGAGKQTKQRAAAAAGTCDAADAILAEAEALVEAPGGARGRRRRQFDGRLGAAGAHPAPGPLVEVGQPPPRVGEGQRRQRGEATCKPSKSQGGCSSQVFVRIKSVDT